MFAFIRNLEYLCKLDEIIKNDFFFPDHFQTAVGFFQRKMQRK